MEKLREDIVKAIQREFNAIKLEDGRFLITFDESTSVRNCRYININVRFQSDFCSLGLIRIQGSMIVAKAIVSSRSEQGSGSYCYTYSKSYDKIRKRHLS